MANRKRRRKRNSDHAGPATPAKKPRVTIKEPEKPVKKGKKRGKRNAEKSEPVRKRRRVFRKDGKKKKYYKRRRMNDLRMKCVRLLELALVEAMGMPKIYHLFTERDEDWVPRAPLQAVLSQLKISIFVKHVHFMKDSYWKSLSRFTRIFAIEEEENGKLYIKYWPIYDREAATVYVDKLPEGCNEQKLKRLAKCFGSVADVKVARKGGRWIRPHYIPKKKRDSSRAPPKKVPIPNTKQARRKRALINVGSRPRSFGFIRFIHKDSAEEMVKHYILNDPSIAYERHEQQMEEQLQAIEEEMLENVPVPDTSVNFERHYYFYRRPFCEMATTKLVREIEFLKRRRRRRPWPMLRRLFVLRRRLRFLRGKDFQCKLKAGLCNRPVWMRKKSRKRKLYERHLRRVRSKLEAEEAQARADAIAEEQERLDLLSMLPPVQQPSTSSDPVVPARPTAPVKDLSLIAPPEVKEKKKKKKKNTKKKDRKKYKYFYDENGKFLKKKRRRKRRKMSRNAAEFIFGGVRRFFRDIQVLSMSKYLKLKAEWQGLISDVIQRMRVAHESDQPPDLLPEVGEPPML